MEEKICKIFQCEVKSVDQNNHTVDVVVSSGSTDRHMEAVSPEAFKKRLKTYKAHPVLLSSHDYGDLMKQIGEALSVSVKDGQLVAKFKYYVGEGNTEADWAFNLASKKVASYSIGFIAHKYENSDISWEQAKADNKPLRTYTDVELIEISQVLIPSNRDAVQERRAELSEMITPEKEEANKKSGVVVAPWVYEAVELCTKALETSDLLAKKDAKIPDPVIPKEIPAEDPILKAMNEEFKKEIQGLKLLLAECVGRIDEMKSSQVDVEALAKSVLGLMKSDAEIEKKLKSLAMDAVSDIVNEDFYRDALFGKVGPKGQQPTQEKGQSLKEIMIDIAKQTKI